MPADLFMLRTHLVGEVCDPGDTIPLAIWRREYDKATREPTGRCILERARKLEEVFSDLVKGVNVVICSKCKAERKASSRMTLETHKGCGGEWEDLIDEYFHGPEGSLAYVPEKYRWIACYPVTGGSEGHYIHIDFLCEDMDAHGRGTGKWKTVRLALGKTFRGMDHAAAIALRCAKLLGA